VNCAICGGKLNNVKEQKSARYRGEIVSVQREIMRCDTCGEVYLSPQQSDAHVRAVKNEVRRKEGLLSPERIKAIRNKLNLSQVELENVLGTGAKVVVRWENGKVIQNSGQDNILRLLEREPSLLDDLKQIQKTRCIEKEKYARAHLQEVAHHASH
jgi:putative zinc finger/helix-turn-helix YgiT family protein